jgi:large conductance mechanosensitive channel
MSKIVKEFKEFAVKGNVIDMAVGIIVGAAFGKIVTSLVNDVVMPPIGLLGGVNFTDLVVTLKPAVEAAAGVEAASAVVIAYGKFIQTTLDFLIVAWVIFLAVKAINSLKHAPSAGKDKTA